MTNLSKRTKVHSFISKLNNKSHWLSFFSGFFLVFAYAPFSYWWLALLLPSIVLQQIKDATPKQAAKKVALFAFGWFSSGISWVHVSIDQFGGLPLIFSLLLMLGLCIYLALFPALAAYLSAKVSKGQRLNLWLLPALWLLCEYLRSVVLTGFPWLSLGYSQIDSPLRVLVPVIGEIGMTLVMLILSITLYQISKKQRVKFNFALLSLVVFASIASNQIVWLEPTGEVKKVALVQGNIAQSLKWQPEQEWPTMRKYLDHTRKNYDADIVVWPESAIPALEPLASEYLDMVDQAAALNNTAVVTGILNYNIESKQYFNSLIVLGKKQVTDTEGSYYYPTDNRFYKHHLLPIGEFVPFQEWLRPLAPFFNLPQSSFSRGDYVQNNLIAHGLHITPLICFEIAFPEQLAANFTEKTSMLLTVSNDAWFGQSHGPHQHMDIARMRALEFGRPLVRSTNTGVTAIVNHQGEYIARLPQFVEDVLKADVTLVSGRTPFSYWQGYPTFIIAAILFVMIFFRERKKTPYN